MSGGVATALKDVIERAGGVGAAAGDGEEAGDGSITAGLFGEFDETETGALDAPSPLSKLLTPPKRKGRPVGSKNRRTEAIVGWLLSQHRHPLSVMMEAYSMTPAELAARIGLDETADLLEIFKLQMRMAEAVAPYVAQRLPQAVQIDAKGGVTIAFEGVSLPARAGSAGNPELDGDALGLKLPFKSDDEDRKPT